MANWNDPGLVWNGGGIWPFFSANAGQKGAILSQIRVFLLRAGREPVEVTTRFSSMKWSTNAVGGFGSCSFTLPGLWRKQNVNYEDLVRVTYGPQILFEGVIEDIGLTLNGTSLDTTVQAFGLARALDYGSLRRIWILRDVSWTQALTNAGCTDSNAVAVNMSSSLLPVTSGIVDPTDPTIHGVQIGAGNSGTAMPTDYGNMVYYRAPIGMTLTKLRAHVTVAAAGCEADVWTTADGTTYARQASVTVNGTFDLALPAGTIEVRFGFAVKAGPVNADTRYVRMYDVQILGSSLALDDTGIGPSAGGFYGDSILRDIVAAAPTLQQGTIESGSDFTIQSILRSTRDSLRSVVNEVAGYYTREWAVWESGRFDWKTPNLDEPQWVVKLSDLSSLDTRGTIDGLQRTSYVAYTDAGSGLDAEASVASSDQRNPFVKQGIALDVVTSPGFAMTSGTSAQLAAKLSAAYGKWAPVTGTVTLPILAPVTHATGPVRPAFMIRGGDNVRVADLPKSDFVTPGRDGETFFHIASTDVSIDDGTVTLTLEGQTRSVDLLLARLAAVTRTLTG